jgi:putative copper export protein
MDPLHLIVRWAHVAGMAAILGGALLVWWLAARRPPLEDRLAARVAEGYEWIFWAAIGLQVMTGVGNLGAFGNTLPPPESAWGTKLTIKLAAVLLLALLSVPRTLAIAARSEADTPPRLSLPVLYGGTTVFVIGILGLAVWLAHG